MNPEPEQEDDEEEEEVRLDDLAEDAEDDLFGGPSKKLKKMQGGPDTDVCVVYTDGSSLGNGMMGARAGAGVYFGPGDPRRASVPAHDVAFNVLVS